jgi:hypothetical protein
MAFEQMIKLDLFDILDAAPAEVAGLLKAIYAGDINGAVYNQRDGCCCLVGTIAKIRGCHHLSLEGITPHSSRPIEVFVMEIRPGDTPDNSKHSAALAEWIKEWQKNKTRMEHTAHVE